MFKRFLEMDPDFRRLVEERPPLEISSSPIQWLFSGEGSGRFFTIATSSRLKRSLLQYKVQTSHAKVQYLQGFRGKVGIPFRKGIDKHKRNALVAALVKVSESGLLGKVKEMWYGQRSIWSSEDSPAFEPASYVQIGSAFCLWGIGVILALGLLSLEVMNYKVLGRERETSRRCHGQRLQGVFWG